jgi:trimeric autotransporter adhesin
VEQNRFHLAIFGFVWVLSPCFVVPFRVPSSGAQLAAGATAWSVMSDRNVKKDFAAVHPVEILDKLATLPITQWHYQWESADATPHIGPMAQDFKAAFYPGRDDKSITTLEADGVALAAIQGLNQKLEQKETEITALKARLERLEQLVIAKNGGAR